MKVPAMQPRVRLTGAPGSVPDAREDALSVPLDGFAWQAVEEESARLGVPMADLVAFAVLYYLADVDSGRVARRITMSPYPRSREAVAGSTADGVSPLPCDPLDG
jgi:hypothetical protein